MSMVQMTTFPLKSDTTDLLDRLERAEARAAKWHAVAREAIAWFEEAREYADTLVTEMRGYDEVSERFAALLAEHPETEGGEK